MNAHASYSIKTYIISRQKIKTLLITYKDYDIIVIKTKEANNVSTNYYKSRAHSKI
jgi:hypothetical protein